MIYTIKNKVFSLGGGSIVTDENGNSDIRVKGKAFSIKKKKMICDANGTVLYRVKNKLCTISKRSAYICDARGKKIARVYTRQFRIENRFHVSECVHDITVEGRLFRTGYDVTIDGEACAKIRKLLTVSRKIDEFELDTNDLERLPFLVALVIAMDNIGDQHDKEAE